VVGDVGGQVFDIFKDVIGAVVTNVCVGWEEP
jgi:hypothetical protein